MKKKVFYFLIFVSLIAISIFVLRLKYENETIYTHIEKNYDYYASKVFRLIPIIIFLLIGIRLILANSKKDFLRFQASLPTSKIKSLAMGIVEINGTLNMKKPLISLVGKEECIGYYYTIEDITKDKDGDNNYTIIHQETKCNIFEICDDSGCIEIHPDGIEFIMLETTNISSNNSRRHTETLIKNGQEMLIVGYADVKNSTPFIRKDTNNNVFGITSNSGITLWNKYSFLYQSFLVTSYLIAMMIAIIVLL